MPAYMQYPGIDGEANGIYYRWIELLSVSWPQASTSLEMVCQKTQDSTSAKLQRASFNGDTADVKIHFTKGLRPGEMTYLKITLKTALISGFNRSGRAGKGPVIESFTLNFEDKTVEYTGDYDQTQISWSIDDGAASLGPL
jgi:type VI protein secretion system component Hcp